MIRYYNQIKRLVERNDEGQSFFETWRRLHGPKFKGDHDHNLDGKQRHTGFDYYEYTLPKFVTPGGGWAQWAHFQENLEYLEHDQACHRVFTTMNAVKPVISSLDPQRALKSSSFPMKNVASNASQVARARTRRKSYRDTAAEGFKSDVVEHISNPRVNST